MLRQLDFSVQEKKRKTDFKDGSHGGHLGFLIGTVLANFDLQVNLILPTKFQELPFPFNRRSKKYIFKMVPMVAILDLGSEHFIYF